MRHRPQTEHLKVDTPIWKRFFRPSMPEWTPAKIAAAFVLASFVIAIALAIYPQQSTQKFSAAPVTTSEIALTNVKLAAYDGLRISEQTTGQLGFSGGRSSTGGISIKGELTNNTPGEIFVLSARFEELPPSYANTETNADPYDWTKTTMDIKGGTYIKNWHQVMGYIVDPDQTVDFHLFTTRFELETTDEFNLAINWAYFDIDSQTMQSSSPVLSFEPSGSSLIWGDPEINIRRPYAEYRPDLRSPDRPR